MNIGSTSGTPGLNVNELFNSGLDSISKKGQALQTKMNEMLSQDQVSPEDMMALQFALVRHQEHDRHDEEPCPAYRLRMLPGRRTGSGTAPRTSGRGSIPRLPRRTG